MGFRQHLVERGRQLTGRDVFRNVDMGIGSTVEEGIDLDLFGGALLFEAEQLGFEDRELSLGFENILLGRLPHRVARLRDIEDVSQQFLVAVDEGDSYHGVMQLVPGLLDA